VQWIAGSADICDRVRHFGCSLRLGAYIPADFRQIPPAAWIKTGQSVAKRFRSNILNETHIDGKIKLTA
jgi:hypothetical protein